MRWLRNNAELACVMLYQHVGSIHVAFVHSLAHKRSTMSVEHIHAAEMAID